MWENLKEPVYRRRQVADTTSRQCSICKLVKDLSEFPNHKAYPLGKHYRCKICDRALSAKYYANNTEKERQRRINYYNNQSVQEKRDYASKYYASNTEKVANNQNRRRARKHNNGGKHTADEWLEKKLLFNNECAICKCTTCKLTRDHIIPLTKGGTDNINNIKPLCRSCNSRKGNK